MPYRNDLIGNVLSAILFTYCSSPEISIGLAPAFVGL